MKMYIDSEFKCHIANPDGVFREVILSQIAEAFFANKCTAFIEGYRLKPEDETWVREDGKVFSSGEMVAPWKPYAELTAAQAQYERDQDELVASYLEGVNSV